MDEATQQQRADKAREWIKEERTRLAAELLAELLDPAMRPNIGHLTEAAQQHRAHIETLDTVEALLKKKPYKRSKPLVSGHITY